MFYAAWVPSIIAPAWRTATARPGFSKPGLSVQAILRELDCPRGIAVLLGDQDAKLAVPMARQSELLIYVQLDSAEQVAAARRALDEAGLLNRRVYVEQGSGAQIHLADNLADLVVAYSVGLTSAAENKLLRVLRPGGKAGLAMDHAARIFVSLEDGRVLCFAAGDR